MSIVSAIVTIAAGIVAVVSAFGAAFVIVSDSKTRIKVLEKRIKTFEDKFEELAKEEHSKQLDYCERITKLETVIRNSPNLNERVTKMEGYLQSISK